jgi:hypothetical protein
MPPARVVRNGLAGQAQSDGGHAAARRLAQALRRRGIDGAYLGGERGNIGRGSENKVPFIAAMQATETGHPVVACFAQRPRTKQPAEEFAASSLARALTVISNGVWCFTSAEAPDVHEQIVAGSRKLRVKLAQFQAVNTVLRNPETGLASIHHAVKFAKCAHRYLAEVRFRFNRRFHLRSHPAAARACRHDHRANAYR